MRADYAAGFASIHQEQPDVEACVQGTLPDWLEGTLLRNGPALWHAGVTPLKHWFDGFAMLHAFTLGQGRVRYRNRFLQSPDLSGARARGQLMHPQFASDPCRGLFKKVVSMFVSEVGANANVNITQIGQRFVALTETPLALEFDPETLATAGIYNYESDDFGGQITSAHPIWEADSLYNFTVRLGRRSRYRGYQTQNGPRREFAHHVTEYPAYVHSCGLSERELVLWEGPLVVRPLDLLYRSRPYIENYRWRPELGSRLILLQREGGSRALELPPLFVFHHVNSFYQQDTLCVDLLAYRDASVIEHLYLDRLCASHGPPLPAPNLLRVRVEQGRAELETLSEVPLELPRIFEPQGTPYRYVYGISRRQSRFYDALACLDNQRGEAQYWWQGGCFPGEPVPCCSPDGSQRLLLSVVLDADRMQSFLLILRAEGLTEVARAYVPAIVPFGFHGGYWPAG
jgi:carotenoid cleavage dioxygenase-like enzyme